MAGLFLHFELLQWLKAILTSGFLHSSWKIQIKCWICVRYYCNIDKLNTMLFFVTIKLCFDRCVNIKVIWIINAYLFFIYSFFSGVVIFQLCFCWLSTCQLWSSFISLEMEHYWFTCHVIAIIMHFSLFLANKSCGILLSILIILPRLGKF